MLSVPRELQRRRDLEADGPGPQGEEFVLKKQESAKATIVGRLLGNNVFFLQLWKV